MSDSLDPKRVPHSSIAVLLVEDDRAAMRRIRLMLEAAQGFAVTHVARVEEALTAIRDGGYDVVLLDLTLPDGHGYEALLRVKVVAESIPIVVMAEEDDGKLALQALRLGVQDFLIKGEVGKQLVSRTLRHAVERHRMLRELTSARQREHFLATHDSLTGLANRYHFEEELHRSVAEAERSGSPMAVLFFDLDGFKAINDNLGHGAGDELLKKVAKRIKGNTRKSDLVSRLGGDEFIMALRSVRDPHAPAQAAENIRRWIERPYLIGDEQCWVSASVGIAMFPRDASEADGLMRCADAAMYHSKSQGKNRACFYEQDMNARVAERFEMVNSLRSATQSGQLEIHYQPQVDVARGTLVGAEALVRWRHPVRGLVSPRDFIPLAEETGMVVPIGLWVLQKACAVAAGWARERCPRVSVNVSGRQLGEADFADHVARIIEETQLDASRLELEITETSVVHADLRARQTLSGLREMGVRVSIDDFGTGYSSLTLLQELRVDAIKIDQSFVERVTAETADQVIVGAVVQMATGLGINAIAEGVETPEQLRRLYQTGCLQMQGYLLGKPVPADEFEEQLHSSTPPWAEAMERVGI